MPKRDDDLALNRLDELRLVHELKEVILEYLTTLHPSSPHGLALLVCRHANILPSRSRDHRSDRDNELIMIRGISYLTPDKTRREIVAESSKAHFSILPALQEFTKDLEREMGKMVEGHGKEKRARDKEWDNGKEEGEGKTRSRLFAEDDMIGDWKGRDEEGPSPLFYENVKKWRSEARDEGSPGPLFYENGKRWRGEVSGM